MAKGQTHKNKAMNHKLHLIFFLVALASGGAAAATADGAEDLGINLFTDLAPLLALFGEQFARQFMSQSLLWLDHVVFAMVPLGILTAIVGAIRVSGPAWARAFIGRARESRAAAEIELMSSTSDEVCEVYNGKAIVRATGQPTITQLILFPGPHKSDDDTCGLHTLETAYNNNPPLLEMHHFGSKPNWDFRPGHMQDSGRKRRYGFRSSMNVLNRIRLRKQRESSEDADLEPGKLSAQDGNQERIAFPAELRSSAPNLQLNFPHTVSDHANSIRELWLASIAAVAIQAAVVAIGAVTSYNTRIRANTVEGAQKYGFPLFLAGTLCLNVGMAICSWVIERGTTEYAWRRPRDISKSETERSNVEQKTERTDAQDTVERDMRFTALRDTKQARASTTNPSRPISVGLGKSGMHPSKHPTRIRVKKAVEEKDYFHLFWLQRKHTVSDQAFKSFLIFGGLKGEVLTSSPNEYTDWHQTFASRLQKVAANLYELVTLCGAFLGVIGFILQFEGLRFLSWPTAVAQIGAILLLALIRAFLRRRLGDRLATLPAREDYELEWLAQRLVYHDYPLDGLTDPKLLQATYKWKVVTITDRPKTRNLVQEGKIFRTRSEIEDDPPTSDDDPRDSSTQFQHPSAHGHVKDDYLKHPFPLKSQVVLKVRHRLGYLTRSQGVASKEAVALSYAIALVLKEVYPPIPQGEHRTFEWYLNTKMETTDVGAQDKKAEKLDMPIERIVLQAYGDQGEWTVHWRDIDAVLSLWMASYTNADSKSTIDEIDNSTGGLVEKGSGVYKYRRVLGEDPTPPKYQHDNDSTITRESFNDNEASHLPFVLEGSQTDESTDALPEARSSHSDLFDDSIGKLHGTNILTRDLNLWIDDPRVVELLGAKRTNDSYENEKTDDKLRLQTAGTDSDNPDLIIGYNGIAGSIDGGNVVFIDSSAPLATILSHHLFSAFMWAISPFISPETFAHTTVEEGERSYALDMQKSWTSPKLRNARLLKIARGIQQAGLGSVEDILLSMIPPLSYQKLLPNGALLEPLLAEAKDCESRHDWRQATHLYQKLLELELDPHSKDRLAFEVIVEVVEFLFLAMEVVNDRNGIDAAIKTGLNDSAQSLASGFSCIRLALEQHPLFRNVIQDLKWFYMQQRRHRYFNTLFPTLGVPRSNSQMEHDLANEVCSPTENIRGLARFTYYHHGDWSIAKPQRWQPFQQKREQLYRNPDIFGWTTLHYAAVGCFNDVEDEQSVDQLCELWPHSHHDLRDKSGRTPLHYAAMHMPLLLRRLDEKKIIGRLSFEIPARDGGLPIHSAARQGNLKSIELLEKIRNTGIDAGDSFGRSILHLAAISDNINVVEHCLSKSIETLPTADELSRRTPLHLALAHNCGSVVPKLLFYELKLDVLMTADAEGVTSIDLLMSTEKRRVLENLVANFPRVTWMKRVPLQSENAVDEPTKCFLAMLEGAVRLGRKEAIEVLFHTVKKRSWSQDLILEAFSMTKPNENFTILPHLLDLVKKDDMDHNEDGDEALAPSSLHGSHEKSRRPGSFNSDGSYPTGTVTLTNKVKEHIARQFGPILMGWVMKNERDDFIDLMNDIKEADLISHGQIKIDWDMPDSDGHSPLLQLAMSEFKDDAVSMDRRQRLLDCLWRSWTPEQKESSMKRTYGEVGMTPLIYAAKNGHDSLVASFINAGADTHAIDKSGQSAFYYALREQRRHVCDILVSRDPQIVNARIGLEGWKHTPLSHAVVHGQDAVLELLSKYAQVDPKAEDENGITPLLWCKKNNKTKMELKLRELFIHEPSTEYQENELPQNARVSTSGGSSGDLLGDFLHIGALLKKTYEVYNACRKAPEEIRLASPYVHNLALLLERIRVDLVNNPYSFAQQGTGLAKKKKSELKQHLLSCERALKRTRDLLNKYYGFQHISLWDRYRWSTTGKKEIAEIKSDLVLATTVLDLFLSREGVESLARVESMLEALMAKFNGLGPAQPNHSLKPVRARVGTSIVRVFILALVISKFRRILRLYRAKKATAKKPTAKPRRPNLPSRKPLRRTSSSEDLLNRILNARAPYYEQPSEHLECWKVTSSPTDPNSGSKWQLELHRRGQTQLRKMVAVFNEASPYDPRALNEKDQTVQMVLRKKNDEEKKSGTGHKWFLLAAHRMNEELVQPDSSQEEIMVILARRGGRFEEKA